LIMQSTDTMSSGQTLTPWQKRQFLLLLATTLLSSTALGSLLPMLPFLILDRGGSPSIVTLLVASFYLANFFAAPVVGRLSDRIGRRFLVQATLLGTAVACTGMMLSTSLLALFVFRILSGVTSTTSGVIQAYATDGLPKLLHIKRISLLAAVGGTGLLVGPMVGGAVGYWVAPAKYAMTVFLLSTLLLLVAALLAYFAMPANNKIETSPAPKASGTAASQKFSWFSDLPPQGKAALVVTFVSAFAFGVMLSITALYTNAAFSWTYKEVGWLLGACALANIAVRFGPAVRIEQKFGPIRTIIGASLITAALFLSLPLSASSVIPFVSLYILFCMFVSILLVVSAAEVSKSAPAQHRGKSMGLNNASYALGVSLSAGSSGLLFQFVNHNFPYIVSGLLLVAGCLGYIYLAKPPSLRAQTASNRG
jgi:DHA1 family tetracycline resistance protein-like MFS transporter